MVSHDKEDLLRAEKQGANSRAVQRIYRLPFVNRNPYQSGSDLWIAYNAGYEMEKLIAG